MIKPTVKGTLWLMQRIPETNEAWVLGRLSEETIMTLLGKWTQVVPRQPQGIITPLTVDAAPLPPNAIHFLVMTFVDEDTPSSAETIYDWSPLPPDVASQVCQAIFSRDLAEALAEARLQNNKAELPVMASRLIH